MTASMRPTASREQGTNSSTHSDRAESTSILGGSGASSASRTVCRSFVGSTGLCTYMNACSRTALSSVSGASSDVMTTTRGACSALRSSARRSSPVIRGIQTSSSIRSNRRRRRISSASTPSFASVTEKPALVEGPANDEPGRVVVIDHQDSAHDRLRFASAGRRVREPLVSAASRSGHQSGNAEGLVKLRDAASE